MTSRSCSARRRGPAKQLPAKQLPEKLHHRRASPRAERARRGGGDGGREGLQRGQGQGTVRETATGLLAPAAPTHSSGWVTEPPIRAPVTPCTPVLCSCHNLNKSEWMETATRPRGPLCQDGICGKADLECLGERHAWLWGAVATHLGPQATPRLSQKTWMSARKNEHLCAYREYFASNIRGFADP